MCVGETIAEEGCSTAGINWGLSVVSFGTGEAQGGGNGGEYLNPLDSKV